MESMGGAISFVSSFGKGTTFTLKLPIQERLN
jgi:signal transduction histidine kinase